MSPLAATRPHANERKSKQDVISTEGRLNRRERFEKPTKFAWSKFERPKVGLQGELQDAIRNAGPKGD